MIAGRRFRGAVSFLTRIPTGTGAVSSEEMATWVPLFPVVGALVGLSGALAYVGARELWSPPLAAALAVLTEVLITGGFHEDGLADTADAIGGATDAADARRILKDPRLGTFGVLAVVLALVLRTGSIASLGNWPAMAALPAGHALSRAAATSVLGFGRIATEDGLAARYARSVDRSAPFASLTVGLLIAAVAIGRWVVPAAAGSTFIAWGMGRAARRSLGGVTGDALGAIQQCVLVIVLLLAAAVETQGWSPLVWWR